MSWSFDVVLDDYGCSSFNLEKAVCNYGLFMMAPNLWLPSRKCLVRPLRLADCSTSVTVSITHPKDSSNSCLHVELLHGIDNHHMKSISTLDKQAILAQVTRMLRLSPKDEKDIQEFHKLHPQARERGFGRLFRSPTIFEDVVKCILLSNCRWQRSLEMAQSLCKLQFMLSNGMIFYCNSNTEKRDVKRKRSMTNDTEIILNASRKEKDNEIQCLGNFPTTRELVNLSVDKLNEHCNLGYRAEIIINLAKRIQSGKLNLESMEMMTSSEEMFPKLIKVKGIGPFVGASIMMCIGFYERVPIDSETKRHLKEVHGMCAQPPKKKTNNAKRQKCSTKRKQAAQYSTDVFMRKLYGKYAPFQCLAFWMELVDYYENKVGVKLSELDHSQYLSVTGSVHKE